LQVFVLTMFLELLWALTTVAVVLGILIFTLFAEHVEPDGEYVQGAFGS